MVFWESMLGAKGFMAIGAFEGQNNLYPAMLTLRRFIQLPLVTKKTLVGFMV